MGGGRLEGWMAERPQTWKIWAKKGAVKKGRGKMGAGRKGGRLQRVESGRAGA